jgi:hypothetical protein
MTQRKKFWLPPNGHSRKLLAKFSSRPEDERPRSKDDGEILPPERTSDAKGRGNTLKHSIWDPEIMPPTKTEAEAEPYIPQPPAPADIGPQLDAAMRRFEHLLKTSLKAFDLDEPEGFLDKYVFERKDHRLAVKIARSASTVELLNSFGKTLEAAERAEETLRRLNRSQQQEYIEQLHLAYTALTLRYRLAHARAATQRQEETEMAKARAEVARYAREARDAESDLRPAPPLPPPPPPVDIRALRREEARRDAEETINARLDATEVAANGAEEKVARAKKRCVEIYQDVQMRAGEKQVRIQEVLDAYNYPWSILPPAIREFMEDGAEEDPTDNT